MALAVGLRGLRRTRDDFAGAPSEPSEIHGCGLAALLEQRPYGQPQVGPAGLVR